MNSIQSIKQYFDYVATGEQAKLLELFTSNCEISFSEDIFKFSGVLKGKEAFQEYSNYLRTIIVEISYHMDQFSYDTSSSIVVVKGSEDISLVEGSIFKEKIFYSLFSFENRLIKTMHVYDQRNYLNLPD